MQNVSIRDNLHEMSSCSLISEKYKKIKYQKKYTSSKLAQRTVKVKAISDSEQIQPGFNTQM